MGEERDSLAGGHTARQDAGLQPRPSQGVM